MCNKLLQGIDDPKQTKKIVSIFVKNNWAVLLAGILFCFHEGEKMSVVACVSLGVMRKSERERVCVCMCVYVRVRERERER